MQFMQQPAVEKEYSLNGFKCNLHLAHNSSL